MIVTSIHTAEGFSLWNCGFRLCDSASMPIRRDMQTRYGTDWRAVAADAREKAGWRCEECGRPQGTVPVVLPDGRWSLGDGLWRDRRGRQAPSPTLFEAAECRRWRVPVRLGACHRGHDPARRDDISVWCQSCHLDHDRLWHRRQRWVTVRGRYAIGDFLLGRYERLRLPGGWRGRPGGWKPRSRLEIE